MKFEDGLKDFGKVTRELLSNAMKRYEETGQDMVFPKRFPQSAKITWIWIKKYIDLVKITYPHQLVKIVDENCCQPPKPAKIVNENCNPASVGSTSPSPKEDRKKEDSSPTPLLYKEKKEEETAPASNEMIRRFEKKMEPGPLNAGAVTLQNVSSERYHFTGALANDREAKNIAEYWNDKCGGSLQAVSCLYPAYIEDIKTSIRAVGEENLKKAIDMVAVTPFMHGENRKQFHATLKWLVKDENVQKVLDGDYEHIGTLTEREFRMQQVGRHRAASIAQALSNPQPDNEEESAVIRKLRSLQGRTNSI